jgi:hypothetical protein
MARTLKEVLMERDGMSEGEAEEAILFAKSLVFNDGCDPEEVLLEEFGLEPDYVMELLEE